MFTSRAEYRTLLRQDNADKRLSPMGYKLGLISSQRMKTLDNKIKKTKSVKEYLYSTSFDMKSANYLLSSIDEVLVKQTDKFSKLLSRPNIKRKDIKNLNPLKKYLIKEKISDEILEQAEIDIKYSGYIEKEKRNVEKLIRLRNIKIPEKFNFNKLSSLSFEAKEKLNKIRPQTLAQASRISGIKPSDISVLLVSMGR